MPIEKAWGIAFKQSDMPKELLYVGHELTRREMIQAHCACHRRADDSRTEKQVWKDRQRLGDRCVRLTISWKKRDGGTP
jgi:hypothetical protein